MPLPLSPEQSQRISAAVGQKVTGRCPLCGQSAWGWLPDLVVLQTQHHETAPELGTLARLASSPPSSESSGLSSFSRLTEQLAGRRTPAPASYPMLLVMCKNCGNTMMLNVYTLGIADIWPTIAAGKVG